MLKSVALDYLFSSIKGKDKTIDEMIHLMNNCFMTEERTRVMTNEWEATKLEAYIKDNPNLSKRECLDKIITRLPDLRSCLPVEYRPDIILKNKLLNACSDIEEKKTRATEACFHSRRSNSRPSNLHLHM